MMRADAVAEENLKITIVTPNYNGAAFIRQTLESVLFQHYPNLEYIVIDGCSTDASNNVIGEFANRLSHYVSEPDNGHADALNKGFSLSTGQIMGWINSDDILLPNSLELINRIFKARPDIEWITGQPTAISDKDPQYFEVQPVKNWSRLRFLCGNYRWIQQESTFWRRSLWCKAGGRLNADLHFAADFELWVRFFRHAELVSIDAKLGSFRRRQGQRSVAFVKEYEAEALTVIKKEFLDVDQSFRRYYRAILPKELVPLSSEERTRREPFLSVSDPEVLTVKECEENTSRLSRNVTAEGPKISVITPSFNQARFLDLCLDSVESQTFRPMEHLVFDPGSNDGSRDIARTRDFVTLIEEADEGQADAVAKGFVRAQGDIIAWINSDDEFADPQVFSRVADRFSRSDHPQIVYGRAIYVDEEGRPIKSVFINSDPSQFPGTLYSSVGISQPATFIHKSVISQIGLPDRKLQFAMDYDYWLRAARAGMRFTFLDRILAKSRYYATNKTAGQRGASYSEICDVLTRHLGYVPDSWLHRYADFLVTGNKGIVKATAPGSRSFEHVAEFERLKERYGRPHSGVVMASVPSNESSGSLSAERPKRSNNLSDADDLTRFKGIHKGKRCFIMGNGPSLNKMDLSLLSSEIVFGCNSVFLLFDRINWRPAYYTCVDSRVLPDRASEISDMLEANPKMVAFFPAMLQEHTGEKRRFSARTLIRRKDNVFFFNEVQNSLRDLPDSMFSRDINNAVVQPYTVAITMLQIAAYMGFSEIYLIGCDTKYTVPENTKKEGLTPKGRVGLALTSTADDDANHFDPRYFGKDRKWHDPQVEMMIEHYRYAKAVLDEEKVRVFNATVGGNLEVFPRIRYESLFEPTAPCADTPFPSTLLFDMTPYGGGTATGELKANIFAKWPGDKYLHVFKQGQNALGVLHREEVQIFDATTSGELQAAIREFDPQVILYRPVADAPALHGLAMATIKSFAHVPLVTWIMDDWLARLEIDDPARFDQMNRDWWWLLERSSMRLSICDRMSEAFRERYGFEFQPFANGVNPSDWPAPRKRRNEVEPFVLRYAGALADDMAVGSILRIAEVVEGLVKRGRAISFEIQTIQHWKDKQAPKFRNLEHTRFSTKHLSAAEYRMWLASGDAVVIGYNFDSESLRYIALSMANKLPECLASGAPLIAHGPTEAATIAYLKDQDCALVIDTPDKAVLGRELERLIDDAELYAGLAARGQEVAFSRHNIHAIRERFKMAISDVFLTQRKHDVSRLSYSRDRKASVDETEVVAHMLRDRIGRSHTMLDIGAHFGTSASYFDKLGWTIHCFEPDRANREKLAACFGDKSNVSVDARAVSDKSALGVPFFRSEESTGISGLRAFRDTHKEAGKVDVTTIAEIVKERELQHVDFLKIDVEGYDFNVLKGVPWDRIKPDVIECEYEDAKTLPMGHSWRDIADFLREKGYAIYISEWHPIVRYGIPHDWRRVVPYPGTEVPSESWGNILAFREDPGYAAVLAAFRKLVKTRPAARGDAASAKSDAPKTGATRTEHLLRESSISKANALFRSEKYVDALVMYEELMARGGIYRHLACNIELCRRRKE